MLPPRKSIKMCIWLFPKGCHPSLAKSQSTVTDRNRANVKNSLLKWGTSTDPQRYILRDETETQPWSCTYSLYVCLNREHLFAKPTSALCSRPTTISVFCLFYLFCQHFGTVLVFVTLWPESVQIYVYIYIKLTKYIYLIGYIWDKTLF